MTRATIQATGAQGRAIELLAKMIANSSTFAGRTQRESVETALDRVFWPFLEDPDQTKKPWAVVKQEPSGLIYQRIAGGDQNYLVPAGTLTLILADYVPSSLVAEDQEIDFRNFCDGVIADLTDVAAKDDLLAITEIREEESPARSHPADTPENDPTLRPFYTVKYAIDWDTV